MKNEYDFSSAKRGAIANNKGKTRITIMLDDAVIEAARARAENAGTGSLKKWPISFAWLIRPFCTP